MQDCKMGMDNKVKVPLIVRCLTARDSNNSIMVKDH